MRKGPMNTNLIYYCYYHYLASTSSLLLTPFLLRERRRARGARKADGPNRRLS